MVFFLIKDIMKHDYEITFFDTSNGQLDGLQFFCLVLCIDVG